MNTYYFTYGDSENQPYYGGWSEVRAESYGEARRKHIEKYGLINGFARFEFQYDEERWQSSRMKDIGVGGIYCHEVIE